VTEAITGFDLAEWQIRVAEGHPLPVSQDQIAASGHAIEARLYAEDPERQFLPQGGRIAFLRMPSGLPGIRVDSGVRAGDVVGTDYDPMLAKIIAHGPDREAARRRLSAALGATAAAGLRTNRRFLRAILDHPAFAAADLDTGFIDRHGELLAPPPKPDDRIIGMAALALLGKVRRDAHAGAEPADPFSPWASAEGWRLNGDGITRFDLAAGHGLLTVDIRHDRSGLALVLPAGPVSIGGAPGKEGDIDAVIGGVRVHGLAAFDGDTLTIFADGESYAFTRADPAVSSIRQGATAGRLTAPMPGTVIAVGVVAGEAVTKGRPLVVVEAMKMEHTLTAPRDGTIARVAVAAGDRVTEGAELIVMEDEDPAPPPQGSEG
jgi:3-methylcrotonyl-CoA carboxylase alpha subunit